MTSPRFTLPSKVTSRFIVDTVNEILKKARATGRLHSSSECCKAKPFGKWYDVSEGVRARAFQVSISVEGDVTIAKTVTITRSHLGDTFELGAGHYAPR